MFVGATAWVAKYERAEEGGTDSSYDSDILPDNGPPSAWFAKQTT